LRLGRPLAGADLERAGQSVLPAVRLIGVLLLMILSLAFLAQVGLAAGAWMEANLGWLSFIGNFIRLLSELTLLLLPALSGLTVALLAASYASRYAQEAVIRLEEGAARALTAVIAAAGSALLLFGIGYAINWICLFGICRQLPEDTPQLLTTLAVPAVVGGLVVGALSALARPKRPYPIGSLTYTVTRGALNLLRAIEPVILGFVLVVWVGLGPFAGVLALMLSSIADLGKLFSEQVENIEQGPIEAVTATGANRLQTIVFAVIPQIVPQYIAFAFYRWDINVRLSTIIGFVGGGGIGLILFRSTNLTQYRQASVMVLAIALVVTVLDYVSSWVRRRIL
jgi:phosphonate ABC transporter permease subunit PhnE